MYGIAGGQRQPCLRPWALLAGIAAAALAWTLLMPVPAGRTRDVDSVSDESISFPVRVIDSRTGQITCFPTPFYQGDYPAKRVYVHLTDLRPGNC